MAILLVIDIGVIIPRIAARVEYNIRSLEGAFSLLQFCQWLAATPGSIALHESIWGYPILESVHVLTLCVFLGLAIVLDLRLLGASFNKTPVSQVIDRLFPFTVAGFVVMVISGALLFYAIPEKN